MVTLPPEVEADLADRAATRLEGLADDREERSARWYGGGSHAFVSSIATADEYRTQARALRAQARAYREQAAREEG